MKKELKSDREKIAYNCRQATLLIEKKQSIALTPGEKFKLNLHLAGCHICRLYEQQSILISQLMGKLLKDPPHDAKLDNTFKENLKQRLLGKMKDRH